MRWKGGRYHHWAPRPRKRHQQEHRPQRPTERSDPMQHAKGRTGDCPGPRKGATTRRNVTQGVPPPPRCTETSGHPPPSVAWGLVARRPLGSTLAGPSKPSFGRLGASIFLEVPLQLC